jgi:hypothetical protein
MARKTTAKGRAGTFTPTEATWARLRAAFVRPGKPGEDPPTLREFARRYKLNGAALRGFLQRADLQGWEAERKANEGREWLAAHGLGATREDEFCVRFALTTYGHLVGNGPEGYALAMAFGRDVWRRAVGPLRAWEAWVELQRAREAYRVVEERDRKARSEAEASSPWGVAA